MNESPTPERVPADARFWAVVAAEVVQLASAQRAAGRDLQAVQVVVPNWNQAASVRAALVALLKSSFVPPRFCVWPEMGVTGPGRITRRAQLFNALRANPWILGNFGALPESLWSLALQIDALADELSDAAIGAASIPADPAGAARIESVLARHYRRRAARVMLPQAQLVLELWRAAGASATAERVAALNRLADAATAPMVFVAGPRSEPWLAGWLARYAARAAVKWIEPDAASVIGASPLLAAAWPELAGGDMAEPIAKRADAVDLGDAPRPPCTILCATSLEAEASAVAQQVLDWLRDGVAAIALVPLDRLTARRVRALLERAQVAVRDETGWKLSTTSAAAAVMRWYELVADDLYWRDVLDWLKSPFTLAGRPGKAGEVAALERAIRSGGAVQGARAIRRALDDAWARDGDAGEPPAGHAGAREVLALIQAQAQASLRGGPTLGAHARTLRATLETLGMRSALAADPVGASVLHEIDALEVELAPLSARATLADFRALLAARFEELSFIDRQVESPVVMVSLAATALRSFDAALLIGADAGHLPSAPAEQLFMSNAVRADLGLATADAELQAQARDLALLLACTPRVVATWRAAHGDEPNTLSPLLERLQFVAARATGDDLMRTPARALFEVEAVAAVRPAPRAAALLPARITASQAQSLVDCAYQFYARRLLGLAELDDVIEVPEKREFGVALHEVLREFHRHWGDAAFHERGSDELVISLRGHARAVFDPQIERAPGMLAFARRFDGLVDGYIEWLRGHSRDGWRWTAGEEKQAQLIHLADGRAIELAGRVDRIDTHADGRVRLIDYKARAAQALKSGLRAPGEDIQLPFYGFLLARRAESAAYLSFDRVKAGDPGVAPVAPPQEYAELVDAVSARLHADLQRVADGAPLPAIGADSVCRRCEMRGLCRRDYWDHEDAGVEQPGVSGAVGAA